LEQEQALVGMNLSYKRLKLHTGSTAYQQYMSPYQQDVINTTLSEFDRQRQMGLAGQSAQAIGAGAFGGAREGIQRSEYGAQVSTR
jgi:hypothetical protein